MSNDNGNRKKGVIVALGGLLGAASAILLANRRTQAQESDAKPVIGMKWGENQETGPQSIVLGTPQKLVLTARNPTVLNWTYDIYWKLGDVIRAQWLDVAIPAGQTVELKFLPFFGSGILGDVDLDGEVSIADVTQINRIVLGLTVSTQYGEVSRDYPTLFMDANQDGVISVADETKIERLVLNLDPLVTIPAPPLGTLSSSVLAIEQTTGTEFNIPTDDITIVLGEGVLSINSLDPIGANLKIDGVDYGYPTEFPLQVNLEPGVHTVTATAEDRWPYSTTVNVIAGQTSNLDIVMSEMYGVFNIWSVPEGAAIQIAGYNEGYEPAWFDFNPSMRYKPAVYWIKATLAGYEEYITQAELTPYETLSDIVRVECVLVPLPTEATVNFTSPAGASVAIDGEVLGVIPCSISVLAGNHNVTLSKDGYYSYSVDMDFVAGQTYDFPAVTLEALYGIFNITSVPAGAYIQIRKTGNTLWVDYVGTQHYGPGQYDIKATLAGYSEYTTIATLVPYYSDADIVNVVCNMSQILPGFDVVSVSWPDEGNIEPPVTTGNLVISTTPVAASIYLDGVYAGVTGIGSALQVEAQEGAHTVLAQASGYDDATVALTVAAGETYNVPIVLTETEVPIQNPTFWQIAMEIPYGSESLIDMTDGMVITRGVDFECLLRWYTYGDRDSYVTGRITAPSGMAYNMVQTGRGTTSAWNEVTLIRSWSYPKLGELGTHIFTFKSYASDGTLVETVNLNVVSQA